MLDVLKDNRVGTLRHLAELVRDAQATSRREGDLSSTRVAELQTAAREAKELWHQIATTARRHLAQYEAGKTSADDVEETFAMLMQATHVLAMCSDALVALPHHSEADLRSVVAEEQDRLYPALPEFLDLCGRLEVASGAWEERHHAYAERLPKSRIARRMHLPAIEVKRGRGSIGIERHFEPEQRALTEARAEELAEITRSASDELPVIIAEVQDDRTVLIGPARPEA